MDLDEWPGRWQDAVPRARTLARRANDARVTAAFAKLLDEMPWTSRGSIELWTIVVRALGKSGDPVARRTVDRLLRSGTTFYDAHVMKKLLREAQAELADVKAAPAAPTTRVADSDEARAVQADALVEKGDPRGELIALQSAPPTKASLARQKALIRAHEKSWLGGLAAAVRKGTTVWERGVLVACTLDDKTGVVKRATGQAALVTVRRVGFHGRKFVEAEEMVRFFSHRVLANLRAVEYMQGFDMHRILELADGRLGHLEEITATHWRDCLAEVHRHFPKLHTIGSEWRQPTDELIRAPIWKRIERLIAWTDDRAIDRFNNLLRAYRSPTLHKLRLRCYRDEGWLEYDRETGVVDVAIDKVHFGDALAEAKGIKLLRVRALRRKLEEEWLRGAATKLGAKLEITRAS
jgi:hypothetical protein